MTRSLAIAQATGYFDPGTFLTTLTSARPPSTRRASRPDRARTCLPTWNRKRFPAAHRLGATDGVLGNPAAGGPFLIADRHEAGDLPTVLTYGHADVLLAETGEESGSPGFGEFCEQRSVNRPSAC